LESTNDWMNSTLREYIHHAMRDMNGFNLTGKQKSQVASILEKVLSAGQDSPMEFEAPSAEEITRFLGV